MHFFQTSLSFWCSKNSSTQLNRFNVCMGLSRFHFLSLGTKKVGFFTLGFRAPWTHYIRSKILHTWVLTPPSILDINKGGSSSGPANKVLTVEEVLVFVAGGRLTWLDLGPVLASLDKDLKPKWTGPPFFRSNATGCLWKCWVCCSCWWCKNSDMWPWGSSLETVPT